QNGAQKSWDFMKTHDSVTILIFNSSRRSLVLVKQFRPAVYAGEVERLFRVQTSQSVTPSSRPAVTYPLLIAASRSAPLPSAWPIPLPAASNPLLAATQPPAFSSCGCRGSAVCLPRTYTVSTCRSGVGLTGSSQTMFYAEVTDAQRGGLGGGLAEEGELIEVVHLPLDGARAFADDPDVPKTLGVIFGISWFFSCVAPGLGLQ
ncbi:hypothetical protein K5549_017509, partial [Capra hircus]